MLVGINTKHKHMKHKNFSFLVRSYPSNQMYLEWFSDKPINKLITSVKHDINDIYVGKCFVVVAIFEKIILDLKSWDWAEPS